MPRPVFVLLLGLGGIFASIAAVLFVRTRIFLARAVETEGRVVRYQVRDSLEYSGGGRASGSYPVIAFTDRAGRAHEFVSSVPAIEGTPEQLPVLYLADHPERAEQKHFRAQMLPALVFVMLAATVLGIAVVVQRALLR